ncbi:MAG TPA: rhamnulokinase family protein, partial [Kineosporiaceae bacterium]|nr:rhamnulokinase family protein [Kineosporiaceae bacterium]
MDHVTVLAVDLGASSGRVMLGRVGTDRLDLTELHRFDNEPVHLARCGGTGLHWDVMGLFGQVIIGLRAAVRALEPGERIGGIGIDTWAVDYGLLDARGELLGTPYCYRDARTATGAARVHREVPRAQLYASNGLQYLPFNTLYQLAADQLAAEQGSPRWAAARTMLLLPDLLGYWLTGVPGAEVTNASTTGLLDARTRGWDRDLAARLGIPAGLLPPLRQPGEVLGSLLPDAAEATGLPAETPVIVVGSHDTASAVAAVPAIGERFGYISSGTWSLVGLELPEPVLTEPSREANFTNEAGVDGTVRYLRNVMGLWLLTESLRTWRAAGEEADLAGLLGAAAYVPAGGPVIDPDDPVFLPPGDMPARVAAACARVGRPAPQTRAGVVRCILDSLAGAYARALD